jgi:hypothetical protein
VVVAASIVAHSGFSEVATAFPMKNEDYSMLMSFGRLENDMRSKMERTEGSGGVQGMILSGPEVCLILNTRPPWRILLLRLTGLAFKYLLSNEVN